MAILSVKKVNLLNISETAFFELHIAKSCLATQRAYQSLSAHFTCLVYNCFQLFSIVWFLPKSYSTWTKAQGRARAHANKTMQNKAQGFVQQCLTLFKLG